MKACHPLRLGLFVVLAATLVTATARADHLSTVNVTTSIPAGGALISRVFAAGAPEYCVDIQAEREWLRQSFAQSAALHAYAGLPLVARGRVQGVMSLLFAERREFTSEEKELMLLLADSVAIAVERSRSAARSLPAA